ITANGGNGGNGMGDGGGGSGGRVAIYYTANSFTGTITINGGTGYVSGKTGSLGTIHLQQLFADAPTSQIVKINNQNKDLGVYTSIYNISGSSNSAIYSVDYTEIAIYSLNTGEFWNGADWETHESIIWQNTTGISNWIYDTTAINWDANKNYLVYTKAVDDQNNAEIVRSEKLTFTFADFVSNIISPGELDGINTSTNISGTAVTINIAGGEINVVQISIKDSDTGKYYNGTNFNSETELWLDTTNTSSNYQTWLYNTVGVPWVTTHEYQIKSRAVDPNDFTESVTAIRKFFYLSGIIINTDTTWSTNKNIGSSGFGIFDGATLTISGGANITNAGPAVFYNSGTSSINIVSSLTSFQTSELITYLGTAMLNTNNCEFNADTILIKSNSALTHGSNTDTKENFLNISATNFTLESGGSIDVTGKGYAGDSNPNGMGYGPGAGNSSNCNNGGGGAGYGG
ncbi:MAG: hypothetical protein KAS15_07150, partial [Nanoarchaeota archaeon]|nr:hypothetical protein [Nanoarchaeota archaeon]